MIRADSELNAVLMIAAGHDVEIATPSGAVVVFANGQIVYEPDVPEDRRYGSALYSAAIKLGQLIAVVPPGVLEQWGGKGRLAGALIMIHKAESYLP